MLDRLAKWKYLRLLSGVYLAMFLVRVAFGIVIITFGHYVVADDFVFGLVVSSSPLLELITVVFVGMLVDRYGRKQVLLSGLGLAAFALYGLALVSAEHYILLGVVNALHGVAAGLILVTTLAIIASLAQPETRGREMGLFNFANMFGWFAGFALGTALLDAFTDLRYTFVLAGFLATLGLVYGQLNIREPPRAVDVERPDFRALARVFRNRRVLVLSAAWLMVFVFIGSLITFFSRFAVPVEDVTDVAAAPTSGSSRVALGILALGVVFMGSQVVFGKLSDRYGREPMMLLGAVSFVCFMLLIVATADARGALAWVALGLATVGTLAFAPAGLAALADEATKSTEGTTMSAYSIVLNIGMITGPPIVGAVSELAGTRGVSYFFVALAVALLALVLLRIYQIRRSRPASPAVA